MSDIYIYIYIFVYRSIKDRISRQTFYYDGGASYKCYKNAEFGEQFLRDESVREHIRMIHSNGGQWTHLS